MCIQSSSTFLLRTEREARGGHGTLHFFGNLDGWKLCLTHLDGVCGDRVYFVESASRRCFCMTWRSKVHDRWIFFSRKPWRSHRVLMRSAETKVRLRECVVGAVEGEELPCQGGPRAVHPFHWIRILSLAFCPAASRRLTEVLVSPCICQRNGHGLLYSSWCHISSMMLCRYWRRVLGCRFRFATHRNLMQNSGRVSASQTRTKNQHENTSTAFNTHRHGTKTKGVTTSLRGTPGTGST